MMTDSSFSPIANNSTGLESVVQAKNVTNDVPSLPPADTFSTIVPALVQVFSVMAAGYVIGRMGILLPHEMKSINVFVARLALPALIFRAMCQLDFNDVNWMLLLAMFLAKITLFLITSVVTILFSSSRAFVLSRAALYSIFVTQSNDLAFGYPIVQAVYSSEGYDFVKYLYLMAPITFLLLNPIGFIMLEIDKLRSTKRMLRQASDATNVGEIAPRRKSSVSGEDTNNNSLATLVRRQRSVFNASSDYSPPVPVGNAAADSAEAANTLLNGSGNCYSGDFYDGAKSSFIRQHVTPNSNNNRRIAKRWAGKCGRQLVVCRLMFNVLKNVFFNNIVLLTFAGIAANFIFRRNLPKFIAGVADVLANSFAAATLFSLGLRMVGQVGSFFGWQALVPLLLIISKTIFLPILGRQFAVIVLSTMPSLSPNDIELLSNFVFLYGTFPTAPTVFVFAQEFGREVDVIGTALVACTFLSAPIMFVSSQMASLVNVSDAMLASVFQTAQFDVAIASATVLVWVLLVMLLTRRARQIPHMFMLALAVAQLVLAVVKIARTSLINSYGLQPHSLSMCTMTAVMLSAAICTRLLVALLATVLLQLHRYADGGWIRRYAFQFITAAIVLSLAITAGLVLVSFLLQDNAAVLVEVSDAAANGTGLYRVHNQPVIVQNYTNTYADIDPTFQFGRAQSVASATVLLLCVAVISFTMARLQTTASLNNSQHARRKSLTALVSKNKKQHHRKNKLLKRSSSQGPVDYVAKEKRESECSSLFAAATNSARTSSTETTASQNTTPIREKNDGFFMEQANRADEKRVVYRRARSDYPPPGSEQKHLGGYSIPLQQITEGGTDKLRRRHADSPDVSLLLRTVEDSIVEEAAVGIMVEKQSSRNMTATSDENQQLLLSRPTPTTLRRAPASTGHLEDAVADFERRQKVCGGSAAAAANVVSFAEEIQELRLIERHMILSELQSWQVPRHALLILINGVFMVIGFFFNTWRLLSPESQNTAIFFELQFLDTLLTMGQGFVTFAIFGLEPQIVLMPLYRRYRRWWHGGVETVRLPALHELNRRAIRSCRIFVRYHVGECKRVLHDKHYVLSKYRNVISGHDMVEFLLESGLATSRQEGVQFGRDLLSGRIIEHVANEYHFYDFDFFYRLSDEGIDLWQQKEPS